MKIEIEIDEKGFLVPQKTKLKKGTYIVDAKNQDLRTIAQNSAIHLYFTMLSRELNDAGYSFTKVIKDKKLYAMDIDWNLILIKNHLWKPIQESLFNKKSTTELNKDDVNRVYETLNRYTSNRMGVSIPFPSYETKLKKENKNE